MKDMKALTAPCGIDCFNCQVYEENISEAMKTQMATQLHMEADQVPCKGCRAQKGCRLHYNRLRHPGLCDGQRRGVLLRV